MPLKLKSSKMQQIVRNDYTPHQIQINRFAFLLLKHFKEAKVKVKEERISFNVEQLCPQDLKFLSELYNSCNGNLGFNVSRWGKGLQITLGLVSVLEVPEYLNNYVKYQD